MGKSMKKKREHLQSMPYEVTPAQRIMREEMEAGVHKPRKLADAMDETFGGPITEDAALSARAHEIIEVHGYGLFLSLKQWTIVQDIVEAALVDDALRQ